MSTTSMSIEEEIRTAAGSVPDPEIRKTMAQLGMIDEVELREGGNAIIRYHLRPRSMRLKSQRMHHHGYKV
jgi:metal-sulfur cluster biosynthetic enzyme